MPKKKLVTAEDLYELQFVEDPQLSPDGKRIAFVKMSLDKLTNKYKRSIWLTDLSTATPTTRQFTFGSKPDTSPRWSPDGKTLAFVSARNDKPQIYLIDLTGGEARAITSMPNGATNPVWSSDGKRIAFNSRANAEERKREDSGKDDTPPSNELEAKHRTEIKEDKEKKKTDPRIITKLPYRTGTEYLDDRYTHIYVMDVPQNGEKVKPYRLTDGDYNFGEIAWTKKGDAIISTQSHDPDYSPWEHTALIRLSVAAKRKPYHYITARGHDYFNPKVSPNGKWIASLRVIDQGSFGHTAHLALMPSTGAGAVDLTLSLDRSVEAYQWSADSKWLYFQAGDQGDTGIYRIGVNGGIPEKVVGGHRVVLSFSVDDHRSLAFVACTPECPVDLYLSKGKSEKRLTDFNKALLTEREVAKTVEIHYKARDGREIQGWYLKPIHFKKNRKYPMVVSMHGGPHVMWSPSTPSMWIEWQLHAARGYAVFYCNPRGADGYGDEFSTTIQNGWGEEPMHDILTGADRIVEMGFVDTKRMALTGGSYAGYMSAWIVGHDHRFACAWAQRGLYSLMSWYGTTDIPQLVEREFELMPFDDVKKSWQHSPLAFVREIKTPLAIEHQDQDYRCPVSDAEQLYTSLKRLRKTVVFYRYPREGHEMSRSGEPHHRVDRLNRMMAWFDKYCKK